jgi:hypothetical protein
MDVWSPNSNNVAVYGNTSFDNVGADGGPVGVIQTAVNGAASNYPSLFGSNYDGIPIGGTGDTNTVEGIYADGNLWNAQFFAAPGINNTAGLLAAEVANTPVNAGIFEVKNDTLIGVENAGENGSDISGMWSVDHNRPPGQCQSGPLPAAGPVGPFPASGGATIQIRCWYNGGSGLSFAESPIVGMSVVEVMDTIGSTTATAPNLGVSNVVNIWGGADTNYAQITDFSLVNVVPPKFTSVTKSGANVIMTVQYNATFGGASYNLLATNNAEGTLANWPVAQSGTIPSTLSLLGTFTLTNAITPGNQYFTLVLPNYAP